MNRFRAITLTALAGLLTLFTSTPALASDPPHTGGAGNIQCVSCHKLHNAPGGTLTSVSGNSNLCLSCHMSGGSAAAKAFVVSDQAVPAGLVGATAGGTSHRWDSGPQGRIIKGTPNASTGTIKPSGVYTGAYSATLEIKISTAGAAGAAKFDWRQTTNGSTTFGAATTAVATSTTATALGTTGISLAFSATGTFVLNDIFYLYVRTDLRAPVSAAMLGRTENGNMMCSSCHDQHSQANAPFDPTSSQTYTAGTTNNRHFQRVANDTGGLCGDCHAARNVGKGGTSHPVNVNRAAAPNTKAPSASLPLTVSGDVHCLTCHDVHKAPTTTPSGMLLRVSNSTTLCVDCHTLADTTTANAHANPTSGILWPGDQYGGSTYPAYTLAADRGACKNCHTPHGWPDAGNPGQKYGLALGARQDNLCMTCHDGAPAKDTRTQIVKAVRHPVARTSGRLVGCGDCHNPHMAAPGIHTYTTTATLDRNRIRTAAGVNLIGSLKGADGVRFNYSGMANWAVPAVASYTKLAGGSPTVPASGAEFEYQICFKCHTSYDPAASTPTATAIRTVAWGGVTNYYSTGTARFTNGSTAVTGTSTVWTAAMVGMYIQKDINSPAYRIAAFVSATSLTLATPYTGVTDATAGAYTITKQQTDLAQEFNPGNASGHPVVTGLNNYTGNGSTNKPLTVGQMKAPWNTNMGTQTMMCSDCHNTEAATPAAQGPHGSAVGFMLRGPNTVWPPTGNLITSYSTTFCANCHPGNADANWSGNVVHKEHDDRSVTCYNCHILVPHGGKLARLIGDGTAGTSPGPTTMPARYAYQSNLANMWVNGFTKNTLNNYSKSNCGSKANGCTTHSSTTNPNW